MASKALLVWCAGTALVCGSAALAATSLWLQPATSRVSLVMHPLPVAPIEVALPEDVPALAVLSVAPPTPDAAFLDVSFFSPTADGSSNLYRPTLDPEAALSTANVVTEAASIVAVDAASRDPRSAILPPPRPRFELARFDTRTDPRSIIAPEAEPSSFETVSPPSLPTWNWGGGSSEMVARGPERVINAGVASWYGPGFHGRKTASGERFDQNDLTAAHRTLPFGSRVKVVDEKSGRSVVVRINDRGPFKHGRVIDLSKAAAQALGAGGLTRVKLVSAN